jgi:hypothetical protein
MSGRFGQDVRQRRARRLWHVRSAAKRRRSCTKVMGLVNGTVGQRTRTRQRQEPADTVFVAAAGSPQAATTTTAKN